MNAVREVQKFFRTIETQYEVLRLLGFSPELTYYKEQKQPNSTRVLVENCGVTLNQLYSGYSMTGVKDVKLKVNVHYPTSLETRYQQPLSKVIDFVETLAFTLPEQELQSLARKGYSIEDLRLPSFMGNIVEYGDTPYYALTPYNLKKRNFDPLNPMWAAVHRGLLLSFNTKYILVVHITNIHTHEKYILRFATQRTFMDFIKNSGVRIASDRYGKVLLTLSLAGSNPHHPDFKVIDSKGTVASEVEGVFLTDIQLPTLPLI